MKNYFATILVLFLCVTLSSAQTSKRQNPNAVSFELGKTGAIYNLNFDHILATKNYGFRLGAGSNFGRNFNVVSLGGGGYYLIGRKNKFFELGLDEQYLIAEEISDDQSGLSAISVYPNFPIKTLYPSLNLGYRRYGKHTLLRVGLSPGLINSEFIPGGYISYGYSF